MKPRLFAVVAIAVAGLACFAPKPRVAHQDLQPPQEKSGPWLLAVTVTNDCRGKGSAELTSRLRDAQGNVVAQEQHEIDLQPHETVTVTMEMHPSGAGPYRATSDVQSPPD